jgi:hypothetical protein
MKRITLLCVLLGLCLSVVAQKVTISGLVQDADSKEAVVQATVQLLKADSSFVVGNVTDLEGKFSLKASAGNYIIKTSYVGYKTTYKSISFKSKPSTLNVGTISLQEDAVMLKGAEVTARKAMVEMRGDTFQYNAASFRVPEGSTLEALVKKLPGAEVSEDGTIKINGKEVKKIMMNGKEFFKDDTQLAMKNIPTNMIEKLKAYDQKSDLARVTGIEDGEEETVLDLSVKKGMNQGWFGQFDFAGGTESRYNEKMMVNRFTDHSQMTLMGSMNNVNDQGFGGGGSWGRGNSNGLLARKNAGFNFNYDNGKKETENGRFSINGNVRIDHTNTDSWSLVNSESFYSSTTSSYANRNNQSYARNTNFNTNYYLEWAPDTMTNIIFRPSFSYSESDGHSDNSSVTFNNNPYLYMTDPLKEYAQYISDSIVVNTNHSTSMNDGRSTSVNGELQLNRKLSTNGRNVNLRFTGGYGDSKSKNYSITDIHYYQQSQANNDGYTNQFNNNPSMNYNYSASLSYSEPIAKGMYLQFRYRYTYKYQDSERGMYSLDSLLNSEFRERYGLSGNYTAEDLYLGYVPENEVLLYTKNLQNSQYAKYNYNNHEAQVTFRWTKDQLHVNAGVGLQPQNTHMIYDKAGQHYDVTRNVTDFAPRVDIRYRFSKTSELRVWYNGRASQPSMTNLLDVVDTSNPLNISGGNPDLDPSWTNSFRLFSNRYNAELQRGWVIFGNFSQTSRSISNAQIYNPTTGGTYSKPMNIDGNWNGSVMVGFNTALGSAKKFNVSTHTDLGYTNTVGYMNTTVDGFTYTGWENIDWSGCKKSTTKNATVSERLSGNYHEGVFDFGINGNFSYRHARNKDQETANFDTYSFNYGCNLNLNFDCGFSLSTDIGESSRRGYEDSSMNTNELIWNAQVSQSFLKGNLVLSAQWYDILKQQSNISRAISATTRTDSWNNAINSYLMFHLIYKLNIFGNKEARAGMRGGPGFGGPGFGGPGGPGGGPGGRRM